MSRIHRRDPEPGERIRVHMNLNDDVLSVKPGAPAEDAGLVITQVEGPIYLLNPEFHVSESGVERVRRERSRKVVAWVWGEYSPEEPPREGGRSAILKFDPFRGPKSFVDSARGREVSGAKSLVLRTRTKPSIIATDPTYR